MTATHAAPDLDDVDRLLGFELLRRIGENWPDWVHRRVESIAREGAHAIRHQISVDLRLVPAYFGDDSRFTWGAFPAHYVPIAQLRKERLLALDVRDESGDASR